MWNRQSAPTARDELATSGLADVTAAQRVLTALSTCEDSASALQVALGTVRSAFGWAYGSCWVVDGDVLRFAQESGAVDAQFAAVTATATFARGVGLSGRTWQRGELVVEPDLGTVTDCVRAPAARRAGVRSGVGLPIRDGDRVVATMDFFTTEVLELTPTRAATLSLVADLISMTLARLRNAEVAQGDAEDSAAVNSVLAALTAEEDANRAVTVALEVTRTSFGWAYASLWQVDLAANVLTMRAESGTVNEEFERVSRTASFAQGVGLAGRAWKQRRVIAVSDLGQVTDCVRAPVAQRAGVRSGVCLPIVVHGEVLATMDFFTTETVVLAPSRQRALESVAALVGATLERINRADELRRIAGELITSVDEVARSATEASARASEAVAGAEEAMGAVTTLSESSTAIGNVAGVISRIAAQTNLLALNATIEAARAGDVGRGFAVVAGEVKDLARATATATDDVAERVQAIQSDSSQTSQALGRISTIINQIHEIQTSLSSVLEEQSAIAATFRAL